VVSANNNPDRTQFLKLKLEIYLGVQELLRLNRQIDFTHPDIVVPPKN